MKISELPAASPVTGAEEIPIVQEGVTKRAPASDIRGPRTGVGDYAGYSSNGFNDPLQHFAEGVEAPVTMGTRISTTANGYYPDQSGGTSFDIDLPNKKVTCLFDGMIQAFFNIDFTAQNAPFGVAYFHVFHSAYYNYSWSSYVIVPLAATWAANADGAFDHANGGGIPNTGIMPVSNGDELTVKCQINGSEGAAGADLKLYEVTYLRVT